MLALDVGGSIVELSAATVVLAVLALLHWRIDRATSRIDKKADSIDRAVNNHPPEQPKLYDIAELSGTKIDVAVRVAEETRREARDSLAAIGRKIDRGIDGLNARFDAVDRRCSSIDDRIDTLDRRSDANAVAIDRLDTLKQDRQIDP